MTFAEKYPATGLDAKNASWAGPAWRGKFTPLAECKMVNGTAYTVGKLPKGFDPKQVVITVGTAATAGNINIAIKKTSDDSSVWAVDTELELDAVKATTVTTNAPGVLTEECDLIITPSADISDGEFAIEIAGYVFGVPFAE